MWELWQDDILYLCVLLLYNNSVIIFFMQQIVHVISLLLFVLTLIDSRKKYEMYGITHVIFHVEEENSNWSEIK